MKPIDGLSRDEMVDRWNKNVCKRLSADEKEILEMRSRIIRGLRAVGHKDFSPMSQGEEAVNHMLMALTGQYDDAIDATIKPVDMGPLD